MLLFGANIAINSETMLNRVVFMSFLLFRLNKYEPEPYSTGSYLLKFRCMLQNR
jgi:hypothetical protein